jgi:putative pyoverdin transport system ATP-binding/permease protein
MIALFGFGLRRAPWQTAAASVQSLIAGALYALLVPLIDLGLSGPPETHLPELFAAVAIASLTLRSVSKVTLTRLAVDAARDLRAELAQRLVDAPLQSVEEAGAPRLQAALAEDVGVAAVGMIQLPLLAASAVTVVTLLGVIGALDPAILGVTLAFVGVGVATYQLPMRWSARRLDRARTVLDDIYDHFRHLTLGNKELKLGPRRPVPGFGPAVDRHRDESFRGFAFMDLAESWGSLLAIGLAGGIVFTAPAVRGADGGSMSGVVLAILSMTGPMEYVLSILPSVLRGAIALDRIKALNVVLEPEPRAAEPTSLPSGPVRTVRLAALTYRYQGADEPAGFAVGPIDLTLRAGEITFVVGGNGSGKTTLAKLLCGLYAPTAGTIEVDGHALQAAEIPAYRSRISAVFADYFLPQRVSLAAAARPDAEALLARFRLDLNRIVRDGALHTEQLSTGQRKRLALALAILEDRDLYLFDEWAADQDPAFRRLFYRELLPELRARGKVLVVVTHDDAYFDGADRLLRMELGALTLDRAGPRAEPTHAPAPARLVGVRE